ncbi:hypothetical protein ACVOMV_27210 (plasmid) [Mesorhizobium atlanticum]
MDGSRIPDGVNEIPLFATVHRAEHGGDHDSSGDEAAEEAAFADIEVCKVEITGDDGRVLGAYKLSDEFGDFNVVQLGSVILRPEWVGVRPRSGAVSWGRSMTSWTAFLLIDMTDETKGKLRPTIVTPPLKRASVASAKPASAVQSRAGTTQTVAQPTVVAGTARERIKVTAADLRRLSAAAPAGVIEAALAQLGGVRRCQGKRTQSYSLGA